MLKINNSITLLENELSFEFVRASGPGGQNVNKVSTTAVLRFNISGSSTITGEDKYHLKQICGKKVNSRGILIIKAQRFRTQEKNRKDALDRLKELILKAIIKPKKRVKTKPSIAAKKKRLENKKKRGDLKENRKKPLV